MVDRVGSGDSFSAGLLYATLHNSTIQEAIEFAVASSALKHTICNDVNVSTVSEIQNLVNSSTCDVKR